MIGLILLFVILCACVSWVQKRVHAKPTPPISSGVLPIIGHVHKMLGDSQNLYRFMVSISEECNQKGGVVIVKLGLAEYYVITDPEDFNTAANQCLQLHYSYAFVKPWLGTGLISGIDISVWSRHRKLLRPAFKQQILDGFMDIFNSAAKKTVDEMSRKVGNGPFNISPFLNQMAMETICRTAFGMQLHEIEGFVMNKYLNAVEKIFHLVTERIQKPWIHSDFLYSFTKDKKILDELVAYVNSINKSVLKSKKMSATSNISKETKEPHFNALLDLVMELADKGEFMERDMYEEMNTIIAAGYETSSNTLMYILLLLGSHINVQNKVIEELQTVFGDSSRDVDKQDLSKLVYTEAVIKETLRLYTFTPVMLRHVHTDVRLKNYTMPAGRNCLLFVCGLHVNPIWGDDVYQFRPERWIDNDKLDNVATSKAFAGFGVGKRLCLGKTYAVMAMKTALVHILRRYSITSDVTQLVLKVEPLLKPVSGNEIALALRAKV